MKEWMKQVPPDEVKNYDKAGFMAEAKIGERTALIVIDVTYGFTGSEGLTMDEAIAEFRPACGPIAWETMPRIARLINMFRELGRPVVFTRGHPYNVLFAGKATKSTRSMKQPPKFNEFPPQIMPREDEFILEKTRASVFFQTPMASYLVQNQIDTVVVCGVSTSGCVRASVVDCFSHGFNTIVIDDCCFDRSNYAHCANLFDMHAKYANVISLDELEPLMLGKQMQKAG
jgi:maleamate amidohydrolase